MASRNKKTGAKKPQGAALPRSTAGSGFEFEDLVGGHLVVTTLTGATVPGLLVQSDLLRTQTSSLGWDVDDLLMSGGPTGGRVHLAVSCKSNLQVTASGLPDDFADACWRQMRKPTFQQASDVLALATRGRHREFG